MTIADTPMQEILRTLWGIQEIDRDLFRVQEELKRISYPAPVDKDGMILDRIEEWEAVQRRLA